MARRAGPAARALRSSARHQRLRRAPGAARPAAPAIVTTLHGTDITLVGSDPSFLPLTRFSIVESDAVTAPSAWLAEATYRNLDVPRDRAIEVIPNFVDTRRFAPAPAGARAGGVAAGGAGPRLELSIAQARRRRGRDLRGGAAPRARTRDDAAAGRRRAGARAHPRVWCRRAALDERVQFLGERTDLPSVLRGADLFLLPSESESFGLAALEAMSCGVPVIASRVGGVPEVVIDGETGLAGAGRRRRGDGGARRAAARGRAAARAAGAGRAAAGGDGVSAGGDGSEVRGAVSTVARLAQRRAAREVARSAVLTPAPTTLSHAAWTRGTRRPDAAGPRR